MSLANTAPATRALSSAVAAATAATAAENGAGSTLSSGSTSTNTNTGTSTSTINPGSRRSSAGSPTLDRRYSNRMFCMPVRESAPCLGTGIASSPQTAYVELTSLTRAFCESLRPGASSTAAASAMPATSGEHPLGRSPGQVTLSVCVLSEKARVVSVSVPADMPAKPFDLPAPGQPLAVPPRAAATCPALVMSLAASTDSAAVAAPGVSHPGPATSTQSDSQQGMLLPTFWDGSSGSSTPTCPSNPVAESATPTANAPSATTTMMVPNASNTAEPAVSPTTTSQARTSYVASRAISTTVTIAGADVGSSSTDAARTARTGFGGNNNSSSSSSSRDTAGSSTPPLASAVAAAPAPAPVSAAARVLSEREQLTARPSKNAVEAAAAIAAAASITSPAASRLQRSWISCPVSFQGRHLTSISNEATAMAMASVSSLRSSPIPPHTVSASSGQMPSPSPIRKKRVTDSDYVPLPLPPPTPPPGRHNNNGNVGSSSSSSNNKMPNSIGSRANPTTFTTTANITADSTAGSHRNSFNTASTSGGGGSSGGMRRPGKKRVTWCDEKPGCSLERHMLFWKDEEAWRCNRQGLLVNLPRAIAPQRPPTPMLAFDTPLPMQEELVRETVTKGVQLESVMVRSPLVFLTIRVANIAYNKDVIVHLTENNWATTKQVKASYLSGASDSKTDRFYATITIPLTCPQIDFAIKYTTIGTEFWDNNAGSNYTVRTSERASSPTLQQVSGMASLGVHPQLPSSITPRPVRGLTAMASPAATSTSSEGGGVFYDLAVPTSIPFMSFQSDHNQFF